MTFRGESNLVRAELRRLFTRRFTKIMMILVIVVLAFAALEVAAHSHPHTPATLAHAKAFIAGQREQNLAQCLVEARSGTPDAEQGRVLTVTECQQMARQFHPSVNEFQGYQFTFRTEAQTFMFLFGGLMALFGFLVGASFIGAEWSSGAMMSLLVWRPQRLRVLFGKLGALLLGVLIFAFVASVAWIATLWTIAGLRGDPGGATSGMVASLALSDVRAIALALMFATAGFGIASMGRHTAAALGVAVGYVVIVEVVLRIVLSAAGTARPQQFLVSSYVFAWLNKTMVYVQQGSCRVASFGGCQPRSWSIHMSHSAVLMGLIVAAALAGSAYSMVRRDVS